MIGICHRTQLNPSFQWTLPHNDSKFSLQPQLPQLQNIFLTTYETFQPIHCIANRAFHHSPINLGITLDRTQLCKTNLVIILNEFLPAPHTYIYSFLCLESCNCLRQLVGSTFFLTKKVLQVGVTGVGWLTKMEV